MLVTQASSLVPSLSFEPPREDDLAITPKNTSMLIIDVQRQLFNRLDNEQSGNSLPYPERVRTFVADSRPHGIHVTWVVLGSEVWSEDHPGVPCCITCDPLKRDHQVEFQNMVRPANLHKYYDNIFEFDATQYIHSMRWPQSTASIKRHDLCRKIGITGLGVKRQDDIVVKYSEGAFTPKFLDRLYRARKIDNLIIFGMNTSACVATSVAQAKARGFRCIVPIELLEDCGEGDKKIHTPEGQKASLMGELGHGAKGITFASVQTITAAIKKNPVLPKNKPPSLFFNWGGQKL